MHHTTLAYLQPTHAQRDAMEQCRTAASQYLATIEVIVPDGADKDCAVRKLREAAMWVNVAITRQPDGTPRL